MSVESLVRSPKYAPMAPIKGTSGDQLMDGRQLPSIQSILENLPRAGHPLVDDIPHIMSAGLKVIQHPVRARSCGFGNLGKRPGTTEQPITGR